MNALLLLSISIRMLATAWSILLVRRTRDFRMSFLTLMLCLMTLRQLLTLWMEFDSLTVVVAKDFIELPGLLVSIMAFLAVFGVRNFIHDMKRAEVALLGSELRYRTIFDSTAVAIWEEDFTELKKELDRLHPEERKDLEKLLATRPDFLEECISKVRILDVNPATVELFEAKSRDELRVSLRRTFVPESWETFRKVVAAIAQGKPRYEGETVVQTLRGKRCTVLFRMVVLPEVYGANRALINMMDITRLRQTEAALRESEARFRRLAEASFEGIFIHRDRMILDVNQTLLDLTGYTRDELVGRDGLCLVVPEDHEFVMSQVVHRTEEPYEVTGLRKDGTTVPLEVRGKTVREAGNELRVVAIRDISERKKAEQLIERERNLLRTLIDNLPDSVYVKDADGRFALVNQELAKRLGVASPEQLTGKTDSDVYPEEIAKIYQARDLEVLKTGRVLANEESEILDSATGKRIYVLGTRVPLFDSDGSVVGLVGTHRDVT
ncbi:MAG: PAS domain S-box protein, partial [Calditrichaeota bacterium]